MKLTISYEKNSIETTKIQLLNVSIPGYSIEGDEKASVQIPPNFIPFGDVTMEDLAKANYQFEFERTKTGLEITATKSEKIEREITSFAEYKDLGDELFPEDPVQNSTTFAEIVKKGNGNSIPKPVLATPKAEEVVIGTVTENFEDWFCNQLRKNRNGQQFTRLVDCKYGDNCGNDGCTFWHQNSVFHQKNVLNALNWVINHTGALSLENLFIIVVYYLITRGEEDVAAKLTKISNGTKPCENQKNWDSIEEHLTFWSDKL
ncbi:MAG: hypothetical protein CMM93_04255 [Rickettsiales bacterium]|nr:hypothetical protein [Rickettsiales bacterium]|tara:strand:+ start:113 stop:895 length:783 start_codon:yes stop_codon:yes gene_type:complete